MCSLESCAKPAPRRSPTPWCSRGRNRFRASPKKWRENTPSIAMPSTSSATSAARVIVQTAEQVKAVQMFIEANFTVLQKDDKGLA